MENRDIISPEADSDVNISPSGVKRAKVSHLGGIILGSDSDDANNVKLHRGPSGCLQVVSGDDTTVEGVDSPNKRVIGVSSISVTEITAKGAIIGGSNIPSENIKIRRSGVSKLDIAKGDSTAIDGSLDSISRAQIGTESIVVGNNSSEKDNVYLSVSSNDLSFQEGDSTSIDTSKRVGINARSESIGTKTSGLNTKIYQDSDNSLEFVSDSISVMHGIPSTAARMGRNSIRVKDLAFGSAPSDLDNIKLRRAESGEAEIVIESDNTLDGIRSSSKAQLNAKAFEVGSSSNNALNLKIRKSVAGELEITQGGDSTLEGEYSANKAQLNVKSLMVGSDSISDDNVKLHRGSVNVLEVVKGNDSTLDNSISSNKVQINAKSFVVGEGSDLHSNIKLHKASSASELDFVLGDDVTLDGDHSPNKTQINVKKLSVGSSATQSENVKLHRGAFSQMEVVSGDDITVDGDPSLFKSQINAKKIGIGNEISSKNVKLSRAADGELDLVLGDDTTVDGVRSPNKAVLNAKNVVIGSSATISDNSKIHRSGINFIQAVNGSDTSLDGVISTNLSRFGFKLEDFSGVSPIGQESRPAWDSVKKDFVVSDGASWKYIGENKGLATRENVGFKLNQNSLDNSLSITLTQADCISNPSVTHPVKISFRDSSVSALWNTVVVSSALNFVIHQDAKLGSHDETPLRIYLYLINNLGTPEFAVSQKFFNGEYLVSTERMSTLSDYTGKLYSFISRYNVPCSCLGYFEITMHTAGYWGTGNITSIYNGIPLVKDDKLTVYNSARYYGVGDIALSGSKTSYFDSTSSLSYEEKTNYEIHLTTTGRPVQLMLQPADPQQLSYIKLKSVSATAEDVGVIAIYRQTLNNGTTTYGDNTSLQINEVIAQFEVKYKESELSGVREIQFPTSMVNFLDFVSSGIQTYRIFLKVSNSNSEISLTNVRLIGYEI